MPTRLYPIVIHRGDDGAFGAVFPDFPGFTNGATIEEVVTRASEALEAAFEAMLEDGEDAPAPTLAAEIEPDMRAGAECIAFAPVSLPGRSRRISVTLPEDLLERIDAVAGNRSRFLAEAASAALRSA
ncbi:Predicted nuclease of the RNAse H fold, HicB family [Albimonas donghaensis]|uniref:Predicted nuclease of the RNAse H fold, HicB family n=1 Tax=Albimonas donghaensis TaxID=356660 RepID=A0A1H3FI49_9RHOB|nr:type II toxin-antitoxin system HicB family antitoxin [Albimonas donghaensis]SDX90803.1 Predicted nuclease of the RNAse H fold, HicB family [Albimonas donghaensis]